MIMPCMNNTPSLNRPEVLNYLILKLHIYISFVDTNEQLKCYVHITMYCKSEIIELLGSFKHKFELAK